MTQREPKLQPAVDRAVAEPAPASTPVEVPLTPESKASVVKNSDVEEPALASSPARSGDDYVEGGPDIRGMSAVSVVLELLTRLSDPILSGRGYR